MFHVEHCIYVSRETYILNSLKRRSFYGFLVKKPLFKAIFVRHRRCLFVIFWTLQGRLLYTYPLSYPQFWPFQPYFSVTLFDF